MTRAVKKSAPFRLDPLICDNFLNIIAYSLLIISLVSVHRTKKVMGPLQLTIAWYKILNTLIKGEQRAGTSKTKRLQPTMLDFSFF